MFDISVIGDVIQDNFLMLDDQEADLHCRRRNLECELCFKYGQKIPVSQVAQSLGGNAANVSVGFSRIGISCHLLTTIGIDKNSSKILEELRSNHINTRYIFRSEKADSNFSTIIVYRGERTILVHHQRVPYHLEEIPKARWLYFTSMSYGSESIYGNIIKHVRDNQVKLIFQPGTYQLRLGLQTLKPILKLSTIIIGNVEELFQLVYQSNDIKDDSIIRKKSVMEQIAKLGPKIIVMTDGVKGAYMLSDNTYYQIESFKVDQVLEPTGAGDAFACAFSSAIILKLLPSEALRWGIVNSSSVVKAIGAQQGLMAKTEIEHSLQKLNIPRVRII